MFAQLCVDYLQGSDLEIAEALSAQVSKFQKAFDRLAAQPKVEAGWDPVRTHTQTHVHEVPDARRQLRTGRTL